MKVHLRAHATAIAVTLAVTATNCQPKNLLEARPETSAKAPRMPNLLLHGIKRALSSEGDGAIFGEPDFREAIEDDLIRLGDSTAALFWASHLSTFETNGWPTNDCVLEFMCGGKCGPVLTNVREGIGELASAALCAGVLVGPGLVVTPSHCAIDFRCAPKEARVAFGFEGPEPLDLYVLPIEAVCFSSDLVLIRLEASEEELAELPPVQLLDSDPNRVDEIRRVAAFGHPLGSARVMTGGNDHTFIHKCSDGTTRATLDSLETSSGSPVYVPHADSSWRLFGLLRGSEGNETTTVGGFRDVIESAAPEDPCQPNEVGPRIVPLHQLHGRLDEVAKLDDVELLKPCIRSSKWCCFTPSTPEVSDECREYKIPAPRKCPLP